MKRPNGEESSDGSREVKKSRTRFEAIEPDETPAPAASEIKTMLEKAQKSIEERKRSQNNYIPPPPPPVVLPIKPIDYTALKIAELQAKIKSKLTTTAIANLIPPVVNNGTPSLPEEPKPGPLILNAEGRTVDAMGREVLLPQYTPTLKANIKAKKRENLKTHLSNSKGLIGKEEAGSLSESKFFDPRVNAKPSARTKRQFHFHEQGKFLQVGHQMRMKAQLEKLQNDISQISRKTGIKSVTDLALVAPRLNDHQDDEDVPELEWWDSVILQTRSYEGSDGQPNLRQETITNLIEHPIQMRAPLDPLSTPYLPVFLTKKEQKKLRRTTRRENWKDKQEKIRIGLEPPPQAKVRISNLMRVLGPEAVQDPTKVEAHVREQMAKRLQNHQEANASRKLTAEQRREKKEKKLQEDTSATGVHVSVYRLKDLYNPAKKYKVETNAKQLHMTGCAVLCKDLNVVVVEGGPKQQKKYRRLMMNRIRWEEDLVRAEGKAVKGDGGDGEVRNSCSLVWEGTTKQRNFGELIFKLCPSEAVAREHFRKHGVEQYWDQACSMAVLENTEDQ